jgi:DNA-binding protein HU-beta
MGFFIKKLVFFAKSLAFYRIFNYNLSINKKEELYMNKSELVARIADLADLSKKDAEKALNSTVLAIQEALVKGEKVVLTGFGTFEVKQRKARVGHDPRTGAQIHIPALNAPTFKAGKVLKEKVR